MWAAVIAVISVSVAFATALIYGDHRWRASTHKLQRRLGAARMPVAGTVDFRGFDSLPPPVARYLRTVLKDGQSLVEAVYLEHSGTFNTGEGDSHWRPFASTQRVITQPPGFGWDARIMIAPGLPVRVHDAYIGGEGLLDAALFGCVRLARMRGAGTIAEGELMRFLAESIWYPTALLPSACLHWEAVDDRSAKAILADRQTTVSLLFSFNVQGLIETARADARGRVAGNEVIPTAWQVRVWNYEERNGMCVPLDGEVAWLLQGKPRPYLRGHLTSMKYEFSASPFAAKSLAACQPTESSPAPRHSGR
jgi:hypothetical protein